MVDSRILLDSTSFPATADAWALTRGIVDSQGNLTSRFPIIIGMPDGSVDLGAFNIGIIQPNRTIKQALQDLETDVSTRMFASNNLSDLVSKPTARTNLGLGTASTVNTGTSGATIPLLSVSNNWAQRQNFIGGVTSTSSVSVTKSNGQEANLFLLTGTSARWAVVSDSSSETGSNAGSNFYVSRFDDNGTFIDTPIGINRATGVVSLGKPLPIASGGTGVTALATLKSNMALNNVDNTSDANKPISTATQTALNAKLNAAGGSMTGTLSTTGALTASGIVRSASTLICDGNGSEGGQLVLGYKSVTNIGGQSNGTWNVDVDGSANFRIFRQALDGGTTSPAMVLAESGNSTLNGQMVINYNGLVTLAQGSAQYTGIGIRNNYANSTRTGTGFIDMYNENGMPVSSVFGGMNIDGSSQLSFLTTPQGSRLGDRRTTPLWIDSYGANFSVPINGRAYPRRAGDGADMNFNWNGQGGQPNWLWGGNDGINHYVYNPSNFNVNYANSAGTANTVSTVVSGTNRYALVQGQMADNDFFRIMIGGDSSNAGWVEIATADDATESIFVRQYTGVFQNVARTLTLLDGNGNTYLPGTINAAEVYARGWFRPTGATGIYWDAYGRGITIADNGATYGNINIYGAGLNGWVGYSIGTWVSMMANGTDFGFHSPQYGDWLLRFDGNRDAFFTKNVTAYSDERLKRNMRPIDNASERRAGMAKAAILYERDGESRVGFGAQTLELSNPEVVKTAEDLLGTKSVNYMDLVAVLSVDNQNLSDRIGSLETALAMQVQINELTQSKYEDLLRRVENAGL